MTNLSIYNWITKLREGNTPDWALDMWHPWEKVSSLNGILFVTSQYTGSAHGLLWQPREAEGRVWGILREVAEKEMGSWDSRDYHKHHLSVVLVTNTYCPFLSNCCGDSLDIEMKRSLPEMKKKCFSISMRLTQLLMIWPKKRPNGNIWKGMKILGRQLLNNYVFLSGKNSMVRTVQPWNLNALDKDIARLGNQHCSLFF